MVGLSLRNASVPSPSISVEILTLFIHLRHQFPHYYHLSLVVHRRFTYMYLLQYISRLLSDPNHLPQDPV